VAVLDSLVSQLFFSEVHGISQLLERRRSKHIFFPLHLRERCFLADLRLFCHLCLCQAKMCAPCFNQIHALINDQADYLVWIYFSYRKTNEKPEILSRWKDKSELVLRRLQVYEIKKLFP